MPPKAKFDKDEIMKTALSIVENDGMDALTARTLGQRLGSSARPIFTVFKNMDEVACETIKKAYDELEQEGYIITRQGKGSHVAPENIELAKEQAQKDAQARQNARNKEIQKKKDAWNTLLGK